MRIRIISRIVWGLFALAILGIISLLTACVSQTVGPRPHAYDHFVPSKGDK